MVSIPTTYKFVGPQRRYRAAPIFDFPSLRDHDDALDVSLDASALLFEMLGPYRRREAVVRAASPNGWALAEKLASALRAPIDADASAREALVVVVDAAVLDASPVRNAVVLARDQGAREIVAVIACAARLALREIARYADAVYCASMRTSSA